MLVVGLTGGIGCGKSAVSSQLESYGRPIVDADIVAREVVEPGEPALNAISAHFGSHILNASGALDRAQLRQVVFQEPKQRQWLESLLHPIIRQRILDKIDKARETAPYVVLASPLLLETDQHLLVDYTVVVDLPESLQISRTCSRDNNDEAQVKRIIAAQMPRSDRLAKADHVIDNSRDLNSLKHQVQQLDKHLLALANTKSI
jgi:dephospho-CoA kinase